MKAAQAGRYPITSKSKSTIMRNTTMHTTTSIINMADGKYSGWKILRRARFGKDDSAWRFRCGRFGVQVSAWRFRSGRFGNVKFFSSEMTHCCV